jgi:hypothetical protein
MYRNKAFWRRPLKLIEYFVWVDFKKTKYEREKVFSLIDLFLGEIICFWRLIIR